MSKILKITLSDENYAGLIKRAKEADMNLNDFILQTLCPETETKIGITPQFAVALVLSTRSRGDRFTLPELFGDQWNNIPKGYSGVFGRQFYKLITEEHSDEIRFTESYNKKRQAIYEKICD